MPLPAIIPFLPSIAAGATALINGITSRVNTNKQNKANKELAQYQYSKDVEMWNKTNEYNLPSSQMQRLKSAGLNPNLVYGNGAGQSQAATMPKYNAPTMSYNYQPMMDPLSMIGAYQDFQIKAQQVDNLKEQNKVIKEEGLIKEFKNKLTESQWDELIRVAGLKNTKLGNEINLGQQQFDQRGELFPHQLDYARGKVKMQDTQMKNVLQAIEESKAREAGTWSKTKYQNIRNKYADSQERMRTGSMKDKLQIGQFEKLGWWDKRNAELNFMNAKKQTTDLTNEYFMYKFWGDMFMGATKAFSGLSFRKGKK